MKSIALVLFLLALGAGVLAYSVVHLGWPHVGFEATGYAFILAAGVAILCLAGAVVASAFHFQRLRHGK